MKKMNFLKILMTLVLAFVFSSTFAQFVSETSSASEAIDSVTVGVNVPYYVEPDIYFNPGWAGTATDPDVAGLVNSTFVWAAPSPAGAGGPAVPTDASAGDNYIEYVFPSVDTYTLSVQETANTCPGTAQTMDVDVIGAPSVTYSADAPGTIIGADLTVCEGDARLTDVVQLAFTQAAIAGSPSYLASYTIDIDTTATTAFTETFSNAAAVATDAATLGLAQPVDHGDGAGFVCLTNAGGDKRTTVYTYTILGVNDRISRKSDYLTNSGALPTGWSLYDTTAETIAITVNPAPVTGPIYHIGNMWAN